MQRYNASQPAISSIHTQTFTVCVDRLSLLFHADLTGNFVKFNSTLWYTQNGIIELLVRICYHLLYMFDILPTNLVNTSAWM